MNEDKSRDGIILYLAKKHGGNVHDQGILTITSKSVSDDDPKDPPAGIIRVTSTSGQSASDWAAKNAADLSPLVSFLSKDEPGQWICWNFGEMRARPTHYTIQASFGGLKSWVVEGSLDGRTWTEIHRQTGNQAFGDGRGWSTASFAVSHSGEFGFIRLTQTEKNHRGDDYLHLYVVEFFGTLSEYIRFSSSLHTCQWALTGN
jgi:hypothetical protein